MTPTIRYVGGSRHGETEVLHPAAVAEVEATGTRTLTDIDGLMMLDMDDHPVRHGGTETYYISTVSEMLLGPDHLLAVIVGRYLSLLVVDVPLEQGTDALHAKMVAKQYAEQVEVLWDTYTVEGGGPMLSADAVALMPEGWIPPPAAAEETT